MVPNDRDSIRDEELRGDSGLLYRTAGASLIRDPKKPSQRALRKSDGIIVRKTRRLIWPDHVETIEEEVILNGVDN
jgi:hypothetical protein